VRTKFKGLNVGDVYSAVSGGVSLKKKFFKVAYLRKKLARFVLCGGRIVMCSVWLFLQVSFPPPATACRIFAGFIF